MFILKGCPRCGGDLSLGLDDEVTCLQCGHELPPSGKEALSKMRNSRGNEAYAGAVTAPRPAPRRRWAA